MSWHFSRALQAAFSEANSLGGERSVPLKSTGTDGTVCSPVKTTARSIHSRFGTTSGRSKDSDGEALLTWFLAGFRARDIPQRLEVATMRMISGRRCGESWQRQLPGTYLPKTSRERQLMRRQTTSNRWVTKPDALPFPRRTWVRTTFGPDIGYVHTATTKANYAAASMQKWPGCRAYVQVFGQPSPIVEEWLMGWPEGWSDTRPLEMAKYRSWLQRHGACSASS